MLEYTSAYTWLSTILGVGVVLSAAEYFAVRHSFASTSVYSWQVFREQYHVRGLWFRTIYDHLGQHKTVVFIILARGVAGVLAIGAIPNTSRFNIAWCLIAFTGLYISWRKPFGDDGADQMTNIVSITVLLCVVIGSGGYLSNVGLWFITTQVLLAYITAGIAKLLSPSWRSGEAVIKVFSTHAYGLPSVGRLIGKVKYSGAFLCWFVIVFECAFLLALILPFNVSVGLLLTAAIFHVSCAVIMGLNNFVWAFLCTYPALIYCLQRSHAVLWG